MSARSFGVALTTTAAAATAVGCGAATTSHHQRTPHAARRAPPANPRDLGNFATGERVYIVPPGVPVP